MRQSPRWRSRWWRHLSMSDNIWSSRGENYEATAQEPTEGNAIANFVVVRTYESLPPGGAPKQENSTPNQLAHVETEELVYGTTNTTCTSNAVYMNENALSNFPQVSQGDAIKIRRCYSPGDIVGSMPAFNEMESTHLSDAINRNKEHALLDAPKIPQGDAIISNHAEDTATRVVEANKTKQFSSPPRPPRKIEGFDKMYLTYYAFYTEMYQQWLDSKTSPQSLTPPQPPEEVECFGEEYYECYGHYMQLYRKWLGLPNCNKPLPGPMFTYHQ